MTDLRAFHADHGAVFYERAGREVVERYRRPERTHRGRITRTHRPLEDQDFEGWVDLQLPLYLDLAEQAHGIPRQAIHLARALPGRLAGKPLPEFVYKDYGSLISLSRYTTLGTLMGSLLGNITFEGWLARLAYRSLYRTHQQTIYGAPRTLLIMLADWFRHRVGPSLKLH
jgi:hypothetical protein